MTAITVNELNKTIKENRQLVKDLKLERERVRIGFLDAETPRLMKLLTDTIRLIEKFTDELTQQRRELKRLRKKPTPLVKALPKRDKKTLKKTGRTLTQSRKHPSR